MELGNVLILKGKSGVTLDKQDTFNTSAERVQHGLEDVVAADIQNTIDDVSQNLAALAVSYTADESFDRHEALGAMTKVISYIDILKEADIEPEQMDAVTRDMALFVCNAGGALETTQDKNKIKAIVSHTHEVGSTLADMTEDAARYKQVCQTLYRMQSCLEEKSGEYGMECILLQQVIDRMNGGHSSVKSKISHSKGLSAAEVYKKRKAKADKKKKRDQDARDRKRFIINVLGGGSKDTFFFNGKNWPKPK